MAKVTNVSSKTVSVLRWKLLPDGRVISPMGELTSDVPDKVAYSQQAKHLADQGILSIEGYSKVVKAAEPVEVEEVEEIEDVEPDEEPE